MDVLEGRQCSSIIYDVEPNKYNETSSIHIMDNAVPDYFSIIKCIPNTYTCNSLEFIYVEI